MREERIDTGIVFSPVFFLPSNRGEEEGERSVFRRCLKTRGGKDNTGSLFVLTAQRLVAEEARDDDEAAEDDGRVHG